MLDRGAHNHSTLIFFLCVCDSIQVWDAVVLQEWSQGLAQEDEVICSDSYPYALNLVQGESNLRGQDWQHVFYTSLCT